MTFLKVLERGRDTGKICWLHPPRGTTGRGQAQARGRSCFPGLLPSSGAQVLMPSSGAFLRSLIENWMQSGTAGSRPGLFMGCWHHTGLACCVPALAPRGLPLNTTVRLGLCPLTFQHVKSWGGTLKPHPNQSSTLGWPACLRRDICSETWKTSWDHPGRGQKSEGFRYEKGQVQSSWGRKELGSSWQTRAAKLSFLQ